MNLHSDTKKGTVMDTKKLFSLTKALLATVSDYLARAEDAFDKQEESRKELLATIDRISSNYADAKDSIKELAKVLGEKVAEVATLKELQADLEADVGELEERNKNQSEIIATLTEKLDEGFEEGHSSF